MTFPLSRQEAYDLAAYELQGMSGDAVKKSDSISYPNKRAVRQKALELYKTHSSEGLAQMERKSDA